MAHFKSEQDLLDAMGNLPSEYPVMRAPGNLTKGELKRWIPMNAFKWRCGCLGVPASSKRRDYYLNACDEHENIEGNFVDAWRLAP